MPIPVACSGCSAKLNAPDSAAGKRVKCPKCQAVIVIPTAPAAAFEVIDDDEPVVVPPAKPARAKAVVDDDDDDKPKKKKLAKAARDDDDDDDDKPKKKKKKAAGSGGTSMTRNLVMGGVLLVLLGVAAFIFADKRDPDTAQNPPPTPVAPPDDPNLVNPPVVVPNPPIVVPKPPIVSPKPKGPAPAKALGELSHVRNAAFSRDGTKLVTAQRVIPTSGGGSRYALQVWDATTGKELALLNDSKEYDTPRFSPDGQRVMATSFSGNMITIWETLDGKTEPVEIDVYKLKGGGNQRLAEFTPDGNAIVYSANDTIRRLDLADQTVKTFDGLKVTNRSYFAVSPTEPIVAFGEGSQLTILDLNTGMVQRPAGAPFANYGLAFSGDGKILALQQYDTIELLEAGTWKKKTTLTNNWGADRKSFGNLWAESLAISKDGSVVAAVGSIGLKRNDRTIALWSGQPMTHGEVAMDGMAHLTLAPDGQTLVAYQSGSVFRVLDVKTGADRFPPQPGSGSPREQLQGLWQQVTAEANGMPLPAAQTPTEIRITGDKLTGIGPEMTLKFYDEDPRWIGLEFVTRQGGILTIPGLFEIADNELKLIIQLVPADQIIRQMSRPTSFDTAGKPYLLYRAKRAGSTGGTTTPAPATKPDFVLNAVDFTKEYEKDIKAADAKYKGKVVRLTGNVITVWESLDGKPYVSVQGGTDEIRVVYAYLLKGIKPPEVNDVRDKPITVQGVCMGVDALEKWVVGLGESIIVAEK